MHQVEYAIEAINNAGTCVGILAKDGVVMACEKKLTSGLLAPSKVCFFNLSRVTSLLQSTLDINTNAHIKSLVS